MLAGESGDRDQVGQVEAALGDNERVQDRVGGEDPLVPFVAEMGRRGHHGQDWALQVYVLLDRFVSRHDGFEPGGGHRVGFGALPLACDGPARDGRVVGG